MAAYWFKHLQRIGSSSAEFTTPNLLKSILRNYVGHFKTLNITYLTVKEKTWTKLHICVLTSFKASIYLSLHLLPGKNKNLPTDSYKSLYIIPQVLLGQLISAVSKNYDWSVIRLERTSRWLIKKYRFGKLTYCL